MTSPRKPKKPKTCGEVFNDWLCSLEAGHAGDHEAWVPRRPAFTWPPAPVQPKPEAPLTPTEIAALKQ